MEETRTRHLARVVAAAALGRREVLSEWYAQALEAGVPVADLQEATLQVFLFAGIPRALGAFEALETAYDGPIPPPPIEVEPVDLEVRGKEVFGWVYGAYSNTVELRIKELHPEFRNFVMEMAYGAVLGRPFLPIADREVLAVAMLAVLGLRRQLRAHARGALRVGVEPDAVRLAMSAAEEAAGQELAEAREIVERAVAPPPSAM